MIPLAVLEAVIDASGAAPRIEAMLPVGVRARQPTARPPHPRAPGPDRAQR